MQEDHELLGPSVVDEGGGEGVGSRVAKKVLGSSGDKGGLEDKESESLPTGFKTVYKIFENFQIKSSLGC